MRKSEIRVIQLQTDDKNDRLKRYTDKDIISALHDSGGLVEIAARSLGCEPKTIYRRLKKSAKVREAIDSEREYSVDLAERNLRKGLQTGEQWATIHTLRYLGSKRGYIEKQQVEHGGSIAAPQTYAEWVKIETERSKK